MEALTMLILRANVERLFPSVAFFFPLKSVTVL